MSELVSGFVAPGWEAVHDQFVTNIETKEDIGAGLCIIHHGQPVVDLIGGYFENTATIPYARDTLQLVFSTTKGVVATAVAMCVERGLLSYDEPVALYWPEFAAKGKEKITVAQMLSHQAGLYTIDGTIAFENALDWNTITQRLADTAPLFPVGSTHGYHAITFGWLAGELVRRVDGRNIGRFIEEEIANPLGIEIYVGLPEQHEHRVSPLKNGWTKVWPEIQIDRQPAPVVPFGPETAIGQALTLNGAFVVRGGFNRRDMHAAEIPAANGISNAPSLARMYAATIGEVDGANGKVRLISEAMMQRASAPITRPDEIDLCLMRQTNFGMGYMTPTALMPLSGPQSFGHSGAGGSISFGDPVRNLAFSYVMNRMGSYLFTDTRASSLIAAASRCADAF